MVLMSVSSAVLSAEAKNQPVQPRPEQMICGINNLPMYDPVEVVGSGQVYERSALALHLTLQQLAAGKAQPMTCPISRIPINDWAAGVAPCADIKNATPAFCHEHGHALPTAPQYNITHAGLLLFFGDSTVRATAAAQLTALSTAEQLVQTLSVLTELKSRYSALGSSEGTATEAQLAAQLVLIGGQCPGLSSTGRMARAKWLADHGLLPQICKLLCHSSPLVQAKALDAMRVLSEQDQYACMVGQAPVLASIAHFATRSADPEVHESARAILQNLWDFGDDDTKQSVRHTVQALVSGLKMDDSNKQLTSARGLATLISGEVVAELAMECGVLPCLLMLLHKWTQPQLQSAVTQVLQTLSGMPQHQLSVVEGGIVGVVSSLVSRLQTNSAGAPRTAAVTTGVIQVLHTLCKAEQHRTLIAVLSCHQLPQLRAMVKVCPTARVQALLQACVDALCVSRRKAKIAPTVRRRAVGPVPLTDAAAEVAGKRGRQEEESDRAQLCEMLGGLTTNAAHSRKKLHTCDGAELCDLMGGLSTSAGDTTKKRRTQ